MDNNQIQPIIAPQDVDEKVKLTHEEHEAEMAKYWKKIKDEKMQKWKDVGIIIGAFLALCGVLAILNGFFHIYGYSLQDCYHLKTVIATRNCISTYYQDNPTPTPAFNPDEYINNKLHLTPYSNPNNN
jgi:hypothetical protein